MGAISMVKEHNTNGGRLMSNIIINIIKSQILIYWFLHFNSRVLFSMNLVNILLRKSRYLQLCVQPAHPQ